MDKKSEEIIENYKDFEEDKRLLSPFGKLEIIRTKELLLRYIESKEKVICDIGGATGTYSFFLSDSGYNRVSLLDIVPKHIDIAKGKAKNHKKLESMLVADARQLPITDNSLDYIILHGPLYHLVDKRDRVKVLNECYRVLKSGGKMLAFTINRYAGLNFGLSEGLVFDDIYYSVIEEEVKTGHRDNNPKKINSFLNAYFHLPKEIKEEVREAGFEVEEIKGVTGPTWNTKDLGLRIEKDLERLMAMAKLVEDEPILSPTILTLARKD